MFSVACFFLVSLAMRRISALYSAAGRRSRFLQASSRLSTAFSKIESVELDVRGEGVMGVWVSAGVLGGVSVRKRGDEGRLGEADGEGLETGMGTRTGERSGD